jgi:dTDP-4-amino-4,6-dideoxygalactose transaminase
MTTAEGGAIITRSRALSDTIRRARSHGMTSNTRQRLACRRPDYDVTILGFNYRMDELRAAVGLVQLRKLPAWNDIRQHLSHCYRRLILELCPSVMVPFDASWLSAHHLLPIVVPKAVGRQSLIDRLRERGIQTTVHYPPVHRLTFYNDLYPDTALPNTEDFAQRELTLPLHPGMTPADVEYVVNSLATALGASVPTSAVA